VVVAAGTVVFILIGLVVGGLRHSDGAGAATPRAQASAPAAAPKPAGTAAGAASGGTAGSALTPAAPTRSAVPGAQSSVPGSTMASSPMPHGLQPHTYPVNQDSVFSTDYKAHVQDVVVAKKQIVVTFESTGKQDLRPPETSCVVDPAGHAYRADGKNLSITTPGHYKGVLYFANPGAKSLDFVYSCVTDYTRVHLFGP
jgi:hypothetical protein